MKERQKERAGGYYTVHICMGPNKFKIPYRVFATSDYQAARIVKEETGYIAHQDEIEGPYNGIFCA